ncbi:sodium:solute symporter family transporter [Anoxynatronum sibiricum]|uniref:Sodium:solute symporter family protein n=1 Tax=Anoxynatronum sibiricum TaxID=210623 RepID=A0ABU9VS17_9CLOT
MIFSQELIVTGLVMVVSLFTALGVWYSGRHRSTAEDFITARGTTDTGMLFSTFLASFLGVFILFTPPEAGAIGGLSSIVGYSMGLAGLYLILMEVGPRIRDYLPEGSTLTDYARQRYGPWMQRLTVGLAIFYMLVHLVAELTAIALVMKEAAGVPLLTTALIVGIGTMIYTAYGGLRASMFTDMIQMGLMGVFLLIVGVGTIHALGGIGQMTQVSRGGAPQLFRLHNAVGIEFGLTLCIAVMVANLFHQGYWQRMYAARNTVAIRRSLKISIGAAVPVMLFTGYLGITAVGMGFSENPSTALFSLVYALFPPSMLLVVLLLALVLVMSTVDTLLNALAATFALGTRDRHQAAGSEKASLMKKARWATFIMVLPLALIAARGYSVLYLFLLADMLCAGVAFPLFSGLYNSKISEKTALAAAMVGIATGVPFFLANRMLISFIVPLVTSAMVVFGGILLEKRSTEAPDYKGGEKA